jgi:hypothetical protein
VRQDELDNRHRRKRSMIFTTNKPTGAWGRVLHDEDLAQAIVDRILERGRILTLDGPSMRTKHLGLDEPGSGTSNQTGDNLARISGIGRPEFPEPTPWHGLVRASIVHYRESAPAVDMPPGFSQVRDLRREPATDLGIGGQR